MLEDKLVTFGQILYNKLDYMLNYLKRIRGLVIYVKYKGHNRKKKSWSLVKHYLKQLFKKIGL